MTTPVILIIVIELKLPTAMLIIRLLVKLLKSERFSVPLAELLNKFL